MRVSYSVFLFLFVVLAGCGKEEEVSSTFQYQYTLNGCDTGQHKAESKEEHCQQLKNHSLNKFCASSLRKEAFESKGCGQWE